MASAGLFSANVGIVKFAVVCSSFLLKFQIDLWVHPRKGVSNLSECVWSTVKSNHFQPKHWRGSVVFVPHSKCIIRRMVLFNKKT